MVKVQLANTSLLLLSTLARRVLTPFTNYEYGSQSVRDYLYTIKSWPISRDQCMVKYSTNVSIQNVVLPEINLGPLNEQNVFQNGEFCRT